MRELLRDMVSIAKPDGRRADGIRACVQPDMVFVEEHDLAGFPLEEGDKIARTLPNGSEEVYFVLDRGYYSAIGGIKAHYQAKARKESAIRDSGHSTVYNLNGIASRVNVNSADSSSNTVNVAVGESFEQLRVLIEQSIEDAQKRSELLHHVGEMEQATGGDDYRGGYTAFVAAAADHMTLIAPFIPFLTSLLR